MNAAVIEKGGGPLAQKEEKSQPGETNQVENTARAAEVGQIDKAHPTASPTWKQRRAARLRVVQALFETRFQPDDLHAIRRQALVDKAGWTDEDVQVAMDRDRFLLIFDQALHYASRHRHLIQDQLMGRNPGQMDRVLYAILWTGVAECEADVGLDRATLVDEYVGMAASFTDEAAVKLVNAVMHRLVDRIREEGVSPDFPEPNGVPDSFPDDFPGDFPSRSPSRSHGDDADQEE